MYLGTVSGSSGSNCPTVANAIVDNMGNLSVAGGGGGGTTSTTTTTTVCGGGLSDELPPGWEQRISNRSVHQLNSTLLTFHINQGSV